jgi:cytochrome c2
MANKMSDKMTNQPNLKRTCRERFGLFFTDQSRRRTIAILSILACSFGLAAFSSAGRTNISAAARAIQHSAQEQSHNNAKPQEDANLSGKSPDELAAYIFEHHHCDNCHTIGAGGKLGFNERGKEVGKGFEGCISLLTSMNVIAQVKPTNRTDDEKHKVARFEQFGCTTCHQIVPGKLGLTSYGQKLKSMHMACTDVERIIAK